MKNKKDVYLAYKEKIDETLDSLLKAKINLEDADQNFRNTYSEVSKLSVVVYTMNVHTLNELNEEIMRVKEEKEKYK